jgi:T4 superinfection immunity protein
LIRHRCRFRTRASADARVLDVFPAVCHARRTIGFLLTIAGYPRRDISGGGAMFNDAIAIIILMLLATIYMLPTLIALFRDMPQRDTIAVLNLVFGWTLVGWIVTMILATNVVIEADRRY